MQIDRRLCGWKRKQEKQDFRCVGQEDDHQSKMKIMNGAKFNVRSMKVLPRIALELKRDPKMVRVFANRLRSKIATAKTSEEVSDNHWEWYAILTLWPPAEVIRLLEALSDPSTRLPRACSLVSLLSGDEKAASLAVRSWSNSA
jgi:hypothetical protein